MAHLTEWRLIFPYNQVKQHPKLLQAMTSLNRQEFEQLLPSFYTAWEAYVQQAYVDRADRQRQYGGENLKPHW